MASNINAKWTDEKREWFLRLIGEGYTTPQIAGIMELSTSSIRKARTRYGVPTIYGPPKKPKPQKTTKPHAPWPDEVNKRMVELAHQGMTAQQIAVTIKKPKRTIANKCRTLGIKLNPAPKGRVIWTPEEIEAVRAMVGNNYSSGRIAGTIGKTRNAVISLCRRNKIKFQPLRNVPLSIGRRNKIVEKPDLPDICIPVQISTPSVTTPFYALKSGQCKWPFGHAAYDMACCGEPVSSHGKPYCEAHNLAAYNPPPPKAFIRGAHRAAYR